MTQPNLTELANAWHERIAQQAPKLNAALGENLREYCAGDPWVANPSKDAMDAILKDDPLLHARLQEELGERYEAVSCAMLLMWSMEQRHNPPAPAPGAVKWNMSQAPDAKLAISNWDLTDSKTTASILAFTLPLAERATPQDNTMFFGAIYDNAMPCLKAQCRKPSTEEGMHHRAEVYAQVGLGAVHAGQAHTQAWQKDIGALCVGTSINQGIVANTLAHSDLPLDAKLNTFKGVENNLWSLPNVKHVVSQALPQEEHLRIPALAWKEASFSQSDPDALAGAVHANRTVVRQYCPEMANLLELVCGPKDWCSQSRIAEIAETLHVGNAKMPENYVSPAVVLDPQQYETPSGPGL